MRLWLRGERARGLASLAVTWADAPVESQTAVAEAPPPPPPQRATIAPPPRPVVAPVAPARIAAPAAAKAVALAAAPPPPPPPGVPLFDIYEPITAPVPSTAEKVAQLEALNAAAVAICVKCRLSETRRNTVFGEGDPDAAILFVGEGPGEDEDRTGRPFVGRAGQKLDEMVGAMGLKREQVYIANIVKCRPPGNRVPGADEVEACAPYLLRQIEIVRPRVIVTLGLSASRFLLRSQLSMGRLRGQWHEWRGIKVMPTYHPSYVLREYTVETRKAVWSDLQKVMSEVGLTPPKSRSTKDVGV